MAKINPFDYVASITTTKVDMMRGTENDQMMIKDYSPWLVNTALSYQPDLVLIANEMNRLHHLDNLTQYTFYLNIVRKKKRPFNKWAKASKNEDISTIQMIYNCSRREALDYLKILDREQIEALKKRRIEGGKK